MRIVLACNGTRGDCEPSVAVGVELQRRGHDVCIAIPPNLVSFAESAGLSAVAYGPDAGDLWEPDFFRNYLKDVRRNLWNIGELTEILKRMWEPVSRYWREMSDTLTPLADGADVLCAGLFFQDVAANVAEYYDIPFVSLHYFPVRPNGKVAPLFPSPVVRSVVAAWDWFGWRMNKKVEDEQRMALGLPKATKPSWRRIIDRGALEIQTYDEICFPGLAAEWAKKGYHRPFVGALSLGLSTDADDDVASWIAAGTPPICFGFGSMPVESPADTVAMIGTACAELGERALICSGWTDYSGGPEFDHVKVVDGVNYAKILPLCRAVVHHGGSGTTNAGLRAGIPALILWVAGDQPFVGAQFKRLKVGTARSFASTTTESLVSDLRRICAPDYVARARDLGARMTPREESIRRTADLVEDFARSKCCV